MLLVMPRKMKTKISTFGKQVGTFFFTFNWLIFIIVVTSHQFSSKMELVLFVCFFFCTNKKQGLYRMLPILLCYWNCSQCYFKFFVRMLQITTRMLPAQWILQHENVFSFNNINVTNPHDDFGYMQFGTPTSVFVDCFFTWFYHCIIYTQNKVAGNLHNDRNP